MAMQPDEELMERLNQFLDEHEMGLADLAREIGWKYNTVWVSVNRHRNVTGEFKWAFQQRYGYDAAQALFGCDEAVTNAAQSQ